MLRWGGRIRGVATYMCRFDLFFRLPAERKTPQVQWQSGKISSSSKSVRERWSRNGNGYIESFRQSSKHFHIAATNKAKNLNVDDLVLRVRGVRQRNLIQGTHRSNMNHIMICRKQYTWKHMIFYVQELDPHLISQETEHTPTLKIGWWNAAKVKSTMMSFKYGSFRVV